MNQTYSFAYDSFGNVTSMKVGSRTLASYQYGPNNGLLLSQTYGNGDIMSFTYDNLGRVKTTTYDDGRVLLYTYNGEGRLRVHICPNLPPQHCALPTFLGRA